MVVFMVPDAVDVHASGAADAHGWVGGKGALRWSGSGSLDLDRPQSDPNRSDASPFNPIVRPTARLHLPSSATVDPGDVAVVRGKEWLVKSVEEVLGPFGGSPMDETACTVEAGDWWP